MTSTRRKSLEELERRIEELEEAVEARDNFIAVATHELRSPLNTIGLSVAGLRILLARQKNSAEIESELDMLERSVQHFSRRAVVLLDITRLNQGRFPFEPEWVDLDPLIRNVASMEAAALSIAHCSLRLQLQPVRGHWDRLAVEQVVRNLLSNAIKYGAGKPITIEVREDVGWAILTVRDEGVGISEADQARMFLKFERAFRRSEFGGFGLGLWIIGRIVEAHHGHIEVESGVNQGSEFRVSLPIFIGTTGP